MERIRELTDQALLKEIQEAKEIIDQHPLAIRIYEELTEEAKQRTYEIF